MHKSQALPISLVVTVLNEASTIEGLFHAIQQQTKAPAELIIVDGGSSDATVEIVTFWLKKLGPTRLMMFRLQGNRSLGRNVGIAHSTQDWIAITDAGCLPEPIWLEELWLKAQFHQESTSLPVVVAGAARGQATTPLQAAMIPYVLVMPDRVTVPFLPATRSVLMSRSAWELVGQFNEELSDNEDYAWSRRLWPLVEKKQLRLEYAENARVAWLPRKSIKEFSHMLFRFARGDAQAGLWRPKVGLLLARYLMAFSWLVILILLTFTQESSFLWWLWILTILTGFGYFLIWPIAKNGRYVNEGKHWLPVLQVVADVAVLRGSLTGWWLRSRGR